MLAGVFFAAKVNVVAYSPQKEKSLSPLKNHQMFMYKYLGDKNTDLNLKGQTCAAIRKNGKCVRGKNGNMLVEFDNGEQHVVIARLLRKIKD